jgi:hypothetical protein
VKGRYGSVRVMSVRQGLALLIAASFAFGSNVDTLRGRAGGRHRWEAIAADVGPFAIEVRPGSVVGVLVQGTSASAKEDEELVRVAQYAFIPSRVRGIAWSGCASSGPAACGLAEAEYLVVGARPPEELAAWGAQLGLAPAGVGRHFALLARKRR